MQQVHLFKGPPANLAFVICPGLVCSIIIGAHTIKCSVIFITLIFTILSLHVGLSHKIL